MSDILPPYEGGLIYDFEETDPRFSVEFLNPCPKLSPTTAVYFDGFSWDERGVVFKYNDGDNLHPRSFDCKVVFPCTFKSMRVFAVTAHQENKLRELVRRSAAAEQPGHIFHFYRCKYSNYYNWCMRQGFFSEDDGFYHYVLVGEDTWIDIFSQDRPKVLCHYFGKHLSEKEYDEGYIFNAFYGDGPND